MGGAQRVLLFLNVSRALAKIHRCYDDSGTVRTFTQAQLTLGGVQGETGMNAQRCSDFCAGYDYFGMSWGFHVSKAEDMHRSFLHRKSRF